MGPGRLTRTDALAPRENRGRKGAVMRNHTALAFDPSAFLTGIEDGRTTREYRNKQVVFSQGDAADAVFYIQSGKVQLTVAGKEHLETPIAV